jgi:NAD(P)-dependent dehydrogenase (short-subunit alcohol dehydrogenase family)
VVSTAVGSRDTIRIGIYNMTEVGGRTAFITGSANGIGLGIARAFAEAGAKLALIDRDSNALSVAKNELARLTAVETYTLDVRDREGFAAVADDITAKLGPVSLVVNNAGVSGGAAAHELSYELWDWGLGINLGGVVNGVQTFLPSIVERGEGGHIINTASGAGLVGQVGGVLYNTAKFAVVGMTEALRADLEPLGIGTTVLCPGPVATGIAERTHEFQSRVGRPMSSEEREAAEARSRETTRLLSGGVQPNDAGKMLLAAVVSNRLYCHTDRIMHDPILARTKELLDAMPAGPANTRYADLERGLS